KLRLLDRAMAWGIHAKPATVGRGPYRLRAPRAHAPVRLRVSRRDAGDRTRSGLDDVFVSRPRTAAARPVPCQRVTAWSCRGRPLRPRGSWRRRGFARAGRDDVRGEWPPR